jgi:2-iminobutanoate/2-iminopropanoate deaminase
MREVISTPNAPQAIGPYSQAIRANGFIFVSGQIPVNPETQQIVEGGVAKQTEQVITNLEAILKAAGSGLDKVVRTGVYLKDMGEFAAMNEVYQRLPGPQLRLRSRMRWKGFGSASGHTSTGML